MNPLLARSRRADGYRECPFIGCRRRPEVTRDFQKQLSGISRSYVHPSNRQGIEFF
jgi:hypothetical protein